MLADDWSFHLRPLEGGRTWFVIRSRGEYKNPELGPLDNFLFWRVLFEPAHFIMERKMMLGIKRRAEALARSRSGREMSEREAVTTRS